MALGDLDERRGVSEVVDELSPAALVVTHSIAVAFESAGLMAPHGPAGGTGRNGSEDFEVECAGTTREFEDAFGEGSVEGSIDLADRRGEEMPLVLWPTAPRRGPPGAERCRQVAGRRRSPGSPRRRGDRVRHRVGPCSADRIAIATEPAASAVMVKLGFRSAATRRVASSRTRTARVRSFRAASRSRLRSGGMVAWISASCAFECR